jgi:hypothetical protein
MIKYRVLNIQVCMMKHMNNIICFVRAIFHVSYVSSFIIL